MQQTYDASLHAALAGLETEAIFEIAKFAH